MTTHEASVTDRTEHQLWAALVDRIVASQVKLAIARGYRGEQADTDPMAHHWRCVSLHLSAARGRLREHLMHPDDVEDSR